jgi:hypothetical protein
VYEVSLVVIRIGVELRADTSVVWLILEGDIQLISDNNILFNDKGD